MTDNTNIADIIYRRTSTRAYSGERLTREEIFLLRDFIDSTEYQKGVFDTVRFDLIENKNDSVFGAYGQITGARYYIAAIAKNNKHSLIDIGFAFERLVLYAQSIGLGTCWLAATSFDRNAAELYVPLKDDEIIAAISPIGQKAETQNSDLSVQHKLKSRLGFDSLFFDMKTGGRIEDEKAKAALQLVQAAPSALNNQPWRVVIDGDIAHFYVVRRINLHLNYDFQMMDIGVALYHYCAPKGKVEFFIDDPKLNNGFEYVISVG